MGAFHKGTKVQEAWGGRVHPTLLAPQAPGLLAVKLTDSKSLSPLQSLMSPQKNQMMFPG